MTLLIYLESLNNNILCVAICYKSPIETFRSKCFIRIPMLKSRGKLNLRLLRVVLTEGFGEKKYIPEKSTINSAGGIADSLPDDAIPLLLLFQSVQRHV